MTDKLKTDNNIDPRILEFVERLGNLDPGQKARLKRNAGNNLNESHNVTGLFYRLLPANVSSYHEQYYFLTATLYPLATSGGTRNFGHSLKLARTTQNQSGLDRRMEILLDADEAQLPFRLGQSIRFLYATSIPVFWPRLLQDLLRWTHPKHFVQQQWAQSYFAE